jgi:hypothetical protein
MLVANTNAIGGYDQSADWWKGVIATTLNHLGVSMEQFLKEVEDE